MAGSAESVRDRVNCLAQCVAVVALSSWLLGTALPCPGAEARGRLELAVRDERGEPLPCRVHLVDSQGEAQRAGDLPFWRNHFVCRGDVSLALAAGRYELAIERGPGYAIHEQAVTLRDDETERVDVSLRRLANLRDAGWYSADLHVHRPPEEIELLMLAEDLDFAPVITWWNNRNYWNGRELPEEPLVQFDGHRLYHLMAGEDEREGGALLYFGLSRPLDIAATSREVPSPLQFAAAAASENPDVWIDIEKPFWWDVPTWLASGRAKSIGIANNHMWRHGMLPNEAWGRPRDKERLPDPLGVAHWSQEIYYHALNAGLRIPPSAGSASGVLPNPVGYNRVYAYVGDEFSHENWWRALSEGKCFVTNGPLVVCRAGGELSGHVFRLADGTQTLPLTISLTSRDRVRNVEVVRNGQVVQTIPCSDAVSQELEAELRLAESGWFLVRANADREDTFRFGCTGPFYVEIGDRSEYISRASCEFFLDWVRKRMDRVRENVESEEDRRAVLRHHQAAETFWEERMGRATAP